MFPSGIGSNVINQQKMAEENESITIHYIDETLIKVGGEVVVWLWIAIEPKSKSILDMRISIERSILVAAEQFLEELIKKYGEYPVSTDGGSWYPQACRFLKLHHHIHSYIMKRVS
jgi:putative transposase